MWSKEKAWEWYKNQPWIVGMNYVPSYAVNSTEMWQKESFDIGVIEKELIKAEELNFNVARVFLQYILYKEDKESFFNNFESFVSVAFKHGIKTMPILFDDCAFACMEPKLGKQWEPLPCVHNGRWTASPGFVYADSESEAPFLESYVKEIVGKYKDDGRIILWDLYNEPGNSERKEKSHKLLKNTFKWAREVNPSQPLSACIWAYSDFDKLCCELSDIINFHDYSDMEITKRRLEFLEQYDRPMVCTEWLNRPLSNTFETHVPLYKEKNIGIVNWGLVAGKTQTYLSWDSSKNPKDGKPEVWQHDIFDEDLNPYNEKEIEFIKSMTK